MKVVIQHIHLTYNIIQNILFVNLNKDTKNISGL
jgi:hypothetical protein